MQLFETEGDLARGLALLTGGWHPLILHARQDGALPWQPDPWSYSEFETALAFLDGLRQTLGSNALLVWTLERLMEEHCFSPAQYWRFRAEFLLECWQATPHAIEDLLEGRSLPAGRRPFILVYRQSVELWSRPTRPLMRFREDDEPICEDHRYSPSPIRREFAE